MVGVAAGVGLGVDFAQILFGSCGDVPWLVEHLMEPRLLFSMSELIYNRNLSVAIYRHPNKHAFTHIPRSATGRRAMASVCMDSPLDELGWLGL